MKETLFFVLQIQKQPSSGCRGWTEGTASHPADPTYPLADVARQQERADDDEKGANQEQHGGERDGLVRDLRRAFLELKETDTGCSIRHLILAKRQRRQDP